MTGTELARLLLPLSGQAYDQALLAHATCLVPWPLVPVRYTRSGHMVEVMVTSDVLALGTFDDPLRVPMGGDLAQAFADHLDLSLITWVVSDAIWAAAPVHLAPYPLSYTRDGGRWMLSVEAFVESNQHIEEARRGREGLIAGHKKDVVLCAELAQHPGRVAIYGWHAKLGGGGHPLQPLNAHSHELRYRDYSHGIRLMGRTVLIDGEAHELAAVLADPALAPLLTGDAPGHALPFTSYPVPSWSVFPDDAPPAPEAEPVPEGADDGLDEADLPEPLDLDTLEQVPARNFTRAQRTTARVIVLHTTENACAPGVARNVATWFAGPSAPQASAHFIVGPDATLQGVPLACVAWAAPGANNDGVQIEQTGRAAFTAADWAGEAQQAMLERVAQLLAALCRRFELPAVFLDAEALKRGERGITTHVEVNRAYHRSTHTDCGPAYPMEAMLRRVRVLLGWG